MAMTNVQRLTSGGDLYQATIQLLGEVIANHVADGHCGVDLDSVRPSDGGEGARLSYMCPCGEVVGVAAATEVEQLPELEWAA